MYKYHAKYYDKYQRDYLIYTPACCYYTSALPYMKQSDFIKNHWTVGCGQFTTMATPEQLASCHCSKLTTAHGPMIFYKIRLSLQFTSCYMYKQFFKAFLF